MKTPMGNEPSFVPGDKVKVDSHVHGTFSGKVVDTVGRDLIVQRGGQGDRMRVGRDRCTLVAPF